MPSALVIVTRLLLPQRIGLVILEFKLPLISSEHSQRLPDATPSTRELKDTPEERDTVPFISNGHP